MTETGAALALPGDEPGVVTSVAPAGGLPAADGVEESPPEGMVHEAVGERVAAAGAVRQQLYDHHAVHAQPVVHVLRKPISQRVDDVQGRPTHEELHHHHRQHVDHALLVPQRDLGMRLAQDAGGDGATRGLRGASCRSGAVGRLLRWTVESRRPKQERLASDLTAAAAAAPSPR